MSAMLIRLGILLSLTVLIWFVVWMGKRIVEARRQRVLTTTTPLSLSSDASEHKDQALVRILAFSSADCRQCKQLQEPALRRVLEERGETVAVVTIDAPSSPEMTERYQVLTLPTTVVLDANGKAHAINYGFANSARLLEQIDGVFAYLELDKDRQKRQVV